jgi:hypothetical protein
MPSPIAVLLELAAWRSQQRQASPVPAKLTMNIVMDVCARFGTGFDFKVLGPGNGNSQNGTDRRAGTEEQRNKGPQEWRS